MNTGPYSDERVQKFLEGEFVPLKSQVISWKHRSELMKEFDIVWTPTFFIQDSNGKIHRKLIGFLPVDDLLAQMKLGKGMVYFDKGRHEEALQWFQKVIDEHPHAGATPEAFYFRGVSLYEKSHEASALREIYDILAEKFPESEWARRAGPYAKIPVGAV